MLINIENNKVDSQILSNNSFNDDTYTIVHTKSSLKLNNTDTEKIESNWKEFLKKSNTKQWDGTYYRMENIEDVISGSKQLNLSTIKYSQVRGLKYDNELSNRLPARNIGTTSLIRTTDAYFIFGVRNSTSTSINKIDLIGGGLQESELVVNNFADVFRNELKEIYEETGLSEEDITSIKGIGIVQSSYSNVLFIFLTQLNKTKEDVHNIFYKNSDEEMIELEFIEEDLLEEYLKDKEDYRPLIAELYFKNLKQ